MLNIELGKDKRLTLAFAVFLAAAGGGDLGDLPASSTSVPDLPANRRKGIPLMPDYKLVRLLGPGGSLNDTSAIVLGYGRPHRKQMNGGKVKHDFYGNRCAPCCSPNIRWYRWVPFSPNFAPDVSIVVSDKDRQ